MMIMSPVSVVHEQMHERAGGQKQPRQPGQDVRAMLRKQEKRTDEGEGKEDHFGARPQCALVVPSCFRHGRLLSNRSR